MTFDKFHCTIGPLTPASLIMLCLLTSGCRIGPTYRLPTVPTAPAYKELDTSTWKTANPNDAAVRGKWWES